MGNRTYAEAQLQLWQEMQRKGWSMSAFHLKIRHATSPNKKLRLWFKPQAIWFTTVEDVVLDKHKHENARSLWFNVRDNSLEKFFGMLDLHFKGM